MINDCNHTEQMIPTKICTLSTELQQLVFFLNALTFTQPSYRPREKASTTKKQRGSCLGQTDTQGSSVPPWRRVKVEGSAAQAMAEKSRRAPPHASAQQTPDPDSDFQNVDPMWDVFTRSREGVKGWQWLSVLTHVSCILAVWRITSEKFCLQKLYY